MTIKVMMLGPYPRSLSEVDGGVAAATLYLSQAIARMPGIDLVGARIAAGAQRFGMTEDLGWPIENIDLDRFSVSTMFYRPMQQFKAILDHFRPHIVHAQGADAAGYLAVRSNYPSVVTIHGMLMECAKYRSSLRRRMREQLQSVITERSVIKRAKHVITISPYVARYYKQRLGGTAHDIPNAVSDKFYRVDRAPEVMRFLFAGRISKGKGLLDLVRATELLNKRDCRIVVAGAAPEREFVLELHAELRRTKTTQNVEIVGLLDESELLTEFSRAAALVLPSYQETAPMVIQQAMAAGLPVIATKVGGIPDLIEHKVSGLLFEPGDVDELQRLMLKVGEDLSFGSQLAAASRSRAVETFSADKVAEATLRTYRQILEQR